MKTKCELDKRDDEDTEEVQRLLRVKIDVRQARAEASTSLNSFLIEYSMRATQNTLSHSCRQKEEEKGQKRSLFK